MNRQLSWLLLLFLCVFPSFDLNASQEIKTGVYINDIQDLDLKSHSYAVDLYIWLKWRDPMTDPSDRIEFLNPYDLWGHVRTKEYEKPVKLPTGEWYQVVRTQGRFSRKLVLDDYPFDHQRLSIEFEDSRMETEEVRFIIDSESVTVNPRLKIPGFRVGKATLVAEDFAYPTGFGLPTKGSATTYSRVVAEVPIERPILTYGSKLLLPILCVIFCATLMFLFHPKYVDVRVGIGITALLTIVALQITLNEDLPQIDYLILMDKIYLASYFFVIAGLALILRSTLLFDRGDFKRAVSLDRRSLLVLTVSYFCAMVFLFGSAARY